MKRITEPGPHGDPAVLAEQNDLARKELAALRSDLRQMLMRLDAAIAHLARPPGRPEDPPRRSARTRPPTEPGRAKRIAPSRERGARGRRAPVLPGKRAVVSTGPESAPDVTPSPAE